MHHVYFANGDGTLSILSAAKACSEFEQVADTRMRIKETEMKKKRITWKSYRAVMTETDARRILESDPFEEQLPPIRIQTKCPVIVLDGSGETRIITGYDRATGILASGKEPPGLSLDKARELILSVCEEYDYVSPADMARYVAHILSPGLKMGGICTFLMPMQYYEADESQSGKGFKTRKVAAFYNDKPNVINRKIPRRGFARGKYNIRHLLKEEYLLISTICHKTKMGRPFHSDKLCSLLTEDKVEARVPYKNPIWVDPSLHTFMLTTNGVTLSDDLGKRTSTVRIKKRHGYKFRKYSEGSILDHIRANQPLYLGAVFAIIKEYVRLGMPKTDVTVHDSSFTPWAQSLDWIVQYILGLAPLLDGFKETQGRITSPDLQWTRDVGLAVKKLNKLGEWLTAKDLLEISVLAGIPLPAIGSIEDLDSLDDDKRETAAKQVERSSADASDFTTRAKTYSKRDSFALKGKQNRCSTTPGLEFQSNMYLSNMPDRMKARDNR